MGRSQEKRLNGSQNSVTNVRYIRNSVYYKQTCWGGRLSFVRAESSPSQELPKNYNSPVGISVRIAVNVVKFGRLRCQFALLLVLSAEYSPALHTLLGEAPKCHESHNSHKARARNSDSPATPCSPQIRNVLLLEHFDAVLWISRYVSTTSYIVAATKTIELWWRPLQQRYAAGL